MRPLESQNVNQGVENGSDRLDQKLKDDWITQGNPHPDMKAVDKHQKRQEALALAHRILCEK